MPAARRPHAPGRCRLAFPGRLSAGGVGGPDRQSRRRFLRSGLGPTLLCGRPGLTLVPPPVITGPLPGSRTSLHLAYTRPPFRHATCPSRASLRNLSQAGRAPGRLSASGRSRLDCPSIFKNLETDLRPGSTSRDADHKRYGREGLGLRGQGPFGSFYVSQFGLSLST